MIVRHGLDVAAEVLSNNPAQLWIDLPDAPAVLVDRTGFQQRRGSGLVWRGRVPYAADSEVVLTRHKGLIAGTIQVDGDTYELLPGRGRGHSIAKLDLDSFPACQGGVIPQTGDNAVAGDLTGGSTQSATTAGDADPAAEIHLLAMYTPQARDAAGGVAQIEATIQAAVDNANTTFLNSNMFARYVLVHTALAGHDDAGSANGGMSTDLSWVLSDSATAALRNQYGADMVSLVVNDGAGSWGLGYVQRSPGSSFAGYAFQVTARSCAVGNLSYAHEHGHNLGFEHDPANSSAYPSGGSYAWSFGAVIGANVARTVMTYPGACNSCPRVMYHSNPDVLYGGYPTGVDNQLDNARTGDTTAYIVHDFRASANPATLTSITVSPATADIDTGATRQFTATGHYDDSTTDDLTFDVAWTSSNAGVVTVNASGVATGQGEGSASITASLDGVTSDTAAVTVTDPPPPTLSSLTVAPASINLSTGQTQALTATGNYSDESTQNHTADATWTSSNPSVATVSGGVVTAVAIGAASITASFDGLTSNTA
ncbi:MAG: Ig-like domain-containing protein, partial [Acidobacteria bacterium]|nr:Ig-like domain-containing protein [Acidobacteriota bacterium]